MRVVVDSNCLQTDFLRAFLEASLENHVILTEYAWIEAFKCDSVRSILKSTAVIADHPSQVWTARGMNAVSALDVRAPDLADRMLLTRDESDFENTVLALKQAEEGDTRAIDQIVAHGRAAEEQILRVQTGAAELQSALEWGADYFTPEELKVIRTSRRRSLELMEKILELVDALCGEMTPSQENKVMELPFGDRMLTFPYRLALAKILYLLELIRRGGALSRNVGKLRNDMIDNTFAVYGSYFNGVMSNDTRLLSLEAELRLVLEFLGATVPDHYVKGFRQQLGYDLGDLTRSDDVLSRDL